MKHHWPDQVPLAFVLGDRVVWIDRHLEQHEVTPPVAARSPQ